MVVVGLAHLRASARPSILWFMRGGLSGPGMRHEKAHEKRMRKIKGAHEKMHGKLMTDV